VVARGGSQDTALRMSWQAGAAARQNAHSHEQDLKGLQFLARFVRAEGG
jgi:hypothetical protein